MSELGTKYIAKAKKLVRTEFPEMTGVEPTISPQKASSKRRTDKPIVVLIFKKSIPLQDGGHLRRVVRVTMDQAGEVIKLSSSK